MLGDRVVLLRFFGLVQDPFLKRFIVRFGCVVVSEGVGFVRDSATVSKGSRLDDADGNPLLLLRHPLVACSWLGGCLLWGNRLKSGVDGGGGYRIEIFYELDAVILGAAASLRLKTLNDNP